MVWPLTVKDLAWTGEPVFGGAWHSVFLSRDFLQLLRILCQWAGQDGLLRRAPFLLLGGVSRKAASRRDVQLLGMVSRLGVLVG